MDNRKENKMSDIKLNDTPVRTSKSFNINNIELKENYIPEKINDFKNVSISEIGNKSQISKEIDNINLKYGVGENLVNQVITNSNYKAKFEMNNKTDKRIDINFMLDKDNSNLVELIQIDAVEESKSTFVMKYQSENGINAFHNGLIKINAKRGSVINVVVLNFLSDKVVNLFSLDNELSDDAKINYYIMDFGGKTSITNYYSNIVGKNADNQLNVIYLGLDDQVIDLNYIAELYGEKSNIDIEVQGALKDKAKKHFKGTIDFKRGCKKATGNENENCMLLSDSAKSLALPMLLCSEEDVEGNHSTSSGKIGDKELFYIMSRGFDRKEAIKLMVKAKFNQILEKIPDTELRNHILYEINTRLN